MIRYVNKLLLLLLLHVILKYFTILDNMNVS